MNSQPFITCINLIVFLEGEAICFPFSMNNSYESDIDDICKEMLDVHQTRK